MEARLKSIFYDPSNEGCFGGVQRLKRAVTEQYGEPVSTQRVGDWLSSQDVYTLHKRPRINYPRNKVVVFGINMQYQADLVDMSMYASDNDGFKYMLTCIDVFSQFAWCVPMKSKGSQDVCAGFEYILETGSVPCKLQTDRGGEFYNARFQKLMSQYNIIHFSTNSELKASVVERFNRTIKERMWKYLTSVNSKRYIDVLQALVTSYNNTYHSAIRMRPTEVSPANEVAVFNNLYGVNPTAQPSSVKYKYAIGDIVRVSKIRTPFVKGYEQNYTHEYFTISERIPRTPPVYKLTDYDGCVIEGSFYEPVTKK